MGTFFTNSEEETIALGYEFADNLKPGDTVSFYGDLGAGKTGFIKGVCRYFNVKDMITSPTFTIMNQYNGTKKNSEIPILHIDLYRIKSEKELESIGFEECIFSDETIKLVEWAEKSFGCLSDAAFSIQINFNDDENGRIFQISKAG